MRILLVQRTIDPPGGGNAVAAWMLQALAGRHQLSTLSERRWHPEEVDRYYGTSLAQAGITQRLPGAAGAIVRLLPGRLDRLRMAVLFRDAQLRTESVDLMVTADNYGAFGRRGLQYVHYPATVRPQPDRWPLLVDAYYAACDRMSGLSWESARLNVSLGNSEWTVRELARHHQITARLLYPPVADPGAGLPWAARANTFLCVGRFAASKRFERVVTILSTLRAAGSDLRLHIVGSDVDAGYTRRLREMARRDAAWITISEDLSQGQVFDLMGRCRYGIHAMESEHFGIAVAEMARAGCVVFVHDSGGQVEAIGGLAALRWRTADEAVARIRDVVTQPALGEELSVRLRTLAARFASERFVAEFREVVEGPQMTPMA